MSQAVCVTEPEGDHMGVVADLVLLAKQCSVLCTSASNMMAKQSSAYLENVH